MIYNSGMPYAGNYPITQYGGANQYGTFPSMPSPTSTTGMLSPAAGIVSADPSTADPNSNTGWGGWTKLPGGGYTGPTLSPAFTSEFSSWLKGQIGKGATPFDLSAVLPSTGGTTAPGTLTAPDNPLMKSLNDFFMGKGGGPDSFVLPMWQSQMKAMQLPIQEQLANLKEQFASRGALGSSEMARSMGDYLTQTALNQQSLLGQETMQALPLMQQQSQATQQLDQSSIQNLLQEFIRTRPEYSPLLQEMFGMSTTFPPIYQGQGGIGQALLGSAGGIMQGGAALAKALPGLLAAL